MLFSYGFFANVVLAAIAVVIYRSMTTLRACKRLLNSRRGIRTMVVLGSGGHTGEMLSMVASLRWGEFNPVFIVADTDTHSAAKAASLEARCGRSEAAVYVIPRPREVGQSFRSAVWPTLRSFAYAAFAVAAFRPRLVLTNGPSTCVPVAYAAALLRLPLLLLRVRVVHCETFAAVTEPSLSTRAVAPIAAALLTPWPALLRRYPSAIYSGRAPAAALSDPAALPPLEPRVPLTPPPPPPAAPQLGKGEGEEAAKKAEPPRRVALVTVGSTAFDPLVRAADSAAFAAAMRRLGITAVRIQTGTGTYRVHELCKHASGAGGFSVTTFASSPSLAGDIARACVVVAHGGAATALEALGAGVPLVVVPNPALHANHQEQLTAALGAMGVAVPAVATPESLRDALDPKRLAALRRFPSSESGAFAAAVARVLGVPPASVARPAGTDATAAAR